MFFDGTSGSFSSDPVLRRCGWGVAVLDFTDVFAPRKTLLVLISENEYFASTA